MNTSSKFLMGRPNNVSKIASIALSVAAVFVANPTIHAASSTWTPTATGSFTWSNSANWSGGNVPGATGTNTNSDTANFSNLTGAETITLDSGRNVQNFNFSFGTTATSEYTLNGGPLVLSAGGSVVLTGGTNTDSQVQFGAYSSTPIELAVTLEGNYTFTNNGTNPAEGNPGANALNLWTNMTGASGIGSYTLTLNGTWSQPALNGSTSVNFLTNSGNLIYGAINQGSGNTMSLVKSGIGTWYIIGTNSYSGSTTLDGGILNVSNLSNSGVTGALGNGSSIIFNGTTLQYSGWQNDSGPSSAAQTTNRALVIGDNDTLASGVTGNTAAFDNEDYNGSAPNASGTGAGTMSFTNTGAITFGNTVAGAHTLTFSGVNLGNNIFNPSISDQVAGVDPTNVVKNGNGTWVLGGINTYTGSTSINGGVLRDGTGSAGTALPTASLLTINSGTFETGASTFTRTLGGAAGNVEILGGQSGFSANGGAVSLTLNTPGSTVAFGSTYFAPSLLVLNQVTANNSLTLNNNLDLNGATRIIGTYANTATINGSIVNNGGGTAGLGKIGNGTLVITGASTYTGGTTVSGGVLSVGSAGSIGTGNALVTGNSELRLNGGTNLAPTATVTLNHGFLGLGYNDTQSALTSTVTSNSTGGILIDSNQSNALDMSALGNGALYLGSSTGGTYSASTLGISPGGNEPDGGIVNTTFGGYYYLGDGGGTLTFTGQNVLTNQPTQILLENYNIGNTPPESLSASNNYNSVIVGDGSLAGQPGGGGTVDLANSQNYYGTTTINPGATLALDFSSKTVTSNILNSTNQVILDGGTLSMIGASGGISSQTLGGVTSNFGNSTVAVNGTGSTSTTLNVGTLSANTGSTILFNQVGSNTASIIQTTSAPTGPESGTITYGPQYVYDNNGTYGWAATSSTGPSYTLTNLTGEAVLPTTGASASADYSQSGTITLAATESANLLRVTGTANENLNIGNNETLNVNGILYTGSGVYTLSVGTASSFVTSSSGNLYLYNYGTGSINFAQSQDAIQGANLNVYFGGTGIYTSSFASGLTYGGMTYLDGATISFGQNDGLFNSTKGIVINSGTTLQAPGNSSTVTISAPLYWNGNFNLGHLEYTLNQNGLNFSGAVTMTNNISITLNTDGMGDANFSGNINDGGYGYGLTVGANSPTLFNSAGLQVNSPLLLSGANNTFTGAVNVLGDGIELTTAGALNRNNVLGLAANTIAEFSTTASIAGINDIGVVNGTSSITDNSTITLFGSGTYSFGGVYSGNGGLTMAGSGTQILTGTNTFAGTVSANAGTLIVDGTQGGSVTTKLLGVGGGTFDFKGAAAGSSLNFSTTTMAAGGSKIVADATTGNATINLGTLSGSTNTAGATLDLAEVGGNTATITTTSGLTDGTLGSHIVFTNQAGVTTWATANTSTSAPFTVGAYSGDTTALVTTGGSSTTNYNIGSGTQNQTGATTTGLVRITDTAGVGALDLQGKTLTLGNAAGTGGILFNGTSSYTIQDSAGGGILRSGTGDKEVIIQNYGSGGASLTISATIGDNSASAGPYALVLAGPGTTVLTGTNTYTGATYLEGGIVNFNKLANLGTGSTSTLNFAGGTLQYASPTAGGNTADITTKTINVAAAGGTIDTNGNNVAFGSNFGNNGTTGGGLTFIDSNAAPGILTINSSATYAGPTTIGKGSTVDLNGALNTTGGTIIANGGTLSGGITQSTSSSQTTANTSAAYAGKITLQSGGTLAPGSLGGGLVVQGAGIGGTAAAGTPGDQANAGFNINTTTTGVANNVLSAAQLTWQAGGTLKFQLDSTASGLTLAQTSAANPSASTVLNLGTGALVKNGSGQYILNFSNTGGYYASADGSTFVPNVYDLINFGSVSTTGGTNGNTNFNVDDFTIENLNGIGVLSFYDNTSADAGAGQEELILTVIPEPSTWAMLIGGLISLVFWTGRKRSSRFFARK